MDAEGRELEELPRWMVENLGEELYPGDEENGSNNGVESGREEVDYSRTRCIEWEAKEVVDLVLNNHDQIRGGYFVFKHTNISNAFNVF